MAHGVVSIELLADGGKINVNKKLLERGFAVTCEESYDSKVGNSHSRSYAMRYKVEIAMNWILYKTIGSELYILFQNGL